MRASKVPCRYWIQPHAYLYQIRTLILVVKAAEKLQFKEEFQGEELHEYLRVWACIHACMYDVCLPAWMCVYVCVHVGNAALVLPRFAHSRYQIRYVYKHVNTCVCVYVYMHVNTCVCVPSPHTVSLNMCLVVSFSQFQRSEMRQSLSLRGASITAPVRVYVHI